MSSAETESEFTEAIALFNQQEFYACHDTLEALWMESIEPDRSFYQGILQIAVACYHLSNQNWRGAMILLGEGSNKLKGYQPSYHRIDITDFLTQSLDLLKQLQESDPELRVNLVTSVPKISFK